MIKINGVLTPTHVEVEELENYVGQTIQMHGAIYKIREMSGFAFVIIRTKSTLLQCVYSTEFSRFELAEIKENMNVVICGNVMKEERSRTGMEVRLIDVNILSQAIEETPVVINNKEVDTTIEKLLDYRPITMRNVKQRAIFKIQGGICEGFRLYLAKNKFTEIHTPKIVFGGAEGGANIFKMDYFGKEAFLTQSPQFYKQMMVGVYERVYEIAPVFRAEKHDTSRHMNEYISVDVEMGFIENFYDICHLETKMLMETLDYVKTNYSDELQLLKVDVPVISEIPAIPFIEAKEWIEKTYHHKITDFEDFEPQEEKLLCEMVKRETNCDFVFVTHYRSSKRPFYTMDNKDNPSVTESFDLLFRGMEITTGGQRIHNYNEQVAKMQAKNMDEVQFTSYLMAHKYGLPPHGGFGLGLERFTAKLLGFQNVRHATMFPRDINRLEP